MPDLKYSEILKQNSSLAKSVTGKPYAVSVLSNVTVNSIKEILEYTLRINGINPAVSIGNFDNIVQDSAECAKSDLVIIFYDTLNIIDNITEFFEDITEKKYAEIRDRMFTETNIIFNNLKSVPSVIFNTFSSACFTSGFFENTKLEAFVKELNIYIEEHKPINFRLLNIDKIITESGLKNAVDFRLYKSSKAPYTLLFLKNYVDAAEHIMLANTGRLKKALIFDCDNTLWKGILGEDGIDKIDMSSSSAYGKPYSDVQQIAAWLSKQGVIIGICSKNNPQDVEEVLSTYPDMVLKNEHLVIKKVNWDDKATNLRAITKELNIGTDSLVFVDDSAFEINLVKEQLPEVAYVQVPATVNEYPQFLLKNIYKYFNLAANKEDTEKTKIYKQQFERENTKSAYTSLDEYLASLEISLTVYEDSLEHLPRIAQLTQKTNQFNLTTKRYTESQVAAFMQNENYHVLAFSVKDKFGDSGLTAFCILCGNDQQKGKAIIDTFLMSCRIIGRNIELAIMDFVMQYLSANGYTTICSKFIPTAKNAQVESFYDKVGFELIKREDGIKEYVFEVEKYVAKNIGYIKLEESLFINYDNQF